MAGGGFRVLGARGAVENTAVFLARAREWSGASGAEVQFLDARWIMGEVHLASAAEHALRAFGQGANLARTLATEVAVYAAAERQISRALEKLGVKDESHELGVVVFGECEPAGLLAALGLERDDGVLAPSESKLRRWGFSAEELASVDEGHLHDLVLERVALLDVEK